MRILDFRVRPPLKGFLQSLMFTNSDRRDRFTRQLGMEPAPSAASKSMDMLLGELTAAGIQLSVIPARYSGMLGSTSNEDVAAIVETYPDRFVGLAAVDPTDRKAAIGEITRAMAAGFRGLNIEPGAYPVPLYPDDRRLYPIYAHCEDNEIPVVIMAGGNGGPDLSYSFPICVDRVAADFPSLRIVISHGGWPWVDQVLHVAFRRPNVFLSPDMYLCNMPGMDDYLKAANGFLKERFIYGSSYPLCPVKQYADWFLKLPIHPEAMERIVWGNAAELLKLKR